VRTQALKCGEYYCNFYISVVDL